MASNQESSEPLNYKTWALKVSIHCEGCKKKVKKIIQNIHGVFTTEIDSQQNKVTVTGDVEAETLIRKLHKSGKHAELWPVEKQPKIPNSNPNDNNGKGKKKQKDKEAIENSGRTPEKSTTVLNSETDTKTAEAGELSEGRSKETSKSKPNPKKEFHETETDTATKIDSSSSSSKKKKEKKVEEPVAGNEEDLTMNSGGVQPMHQHPMYQHPVYQQPVYAANYNMVHPTASANYSYYAPMAPPAQSYAYSGHSMQEDYSYPRHPLQEDYTYSHYPQPEHYRQEESESQGTYDYFNDENANSCNLM